MKKIFCFLLLCSTIRVQGQKRDNIWEEGYADSNNGIINFNQDFPDTIRINRPMKFFVTNGSICDTSGSILFYSNGVSIQNRKGDTFLNSKNFNPGYETMFYGDQGLGHVNGVVILPAPGNSNKYYIMHTSGALVTTPHNGQWDAPLSLRYSLADMALDSGLGGIDSGFKTIHIIKDTLIEEHIGACLNGNGRDWWVVVRKLLSNQYDKILITPYGIEGPYTQDIGSSIIDYAGGQNCFSPDGSKYAFMEEDGTMNLFDFDRCTGMFSNPDTIHVPLDSSGAGLIWGFLGCAFSPSGRFIYVCDNNYLYQYDMQSSNVNTSRQLVAQYHDDTAIDPNNFYLFSYLQLAPDNKIYMGTWGGSKYYYAINSPDSEGLACNFDQYQVALPQYNFSCPTFPNYDLGAETGSACDTLTVVSTINKNDDEIKIIPNPTKGVGKIWIGNRNYEPASMAVYNALGERVYEQNIQHWLGAQSFNITWLPEGFYFIKVEIEGKVFLGKIVKE